MLTHMQALFKVTDTDGDGSISVDECRLALSVALDNGEAADAVMSRVDKVIKGVYL